MKNYRIIVAGLFIALFTSSIYAQETINIPDTLAGWNITWVASLNGTQAAYNNWSPGGVSTVSGTAGSLLRGIYRKERFGYGYVVNLNYGRARIDEQGIRKTDDRIAIRNRWTYEIPAYKSPLKLFATLGFITQFDEGFDYGKGPNNSDLKISDFLAPGYITQNLGLEYSPAANLSFDAGFAMKQTIVRIDSLGALYGVEDGENFRNEAGFGLAIDFSQKIAENINYESQLITFTNINRSFRSTDYIWVNQLTGKINSTVNTVIQFDLMFDDDFSNELQIKQVLAVGVQVNLY